MNTNTEIKTRQQRQVEQWPNHPGNALAPWARLKLADAEISDLRAEVARLQAALAKSDKRVRSLEILVDAYGPKSLQYDIEHPCDGLNALDDREEKQVQGEQAAFENWCVRGSYNTNKWNGDGSNYTDSNTLSAWLAWQARAAIAQRVGCGEPVAMDSQLRQRINHLGLHDANVHSALMVCRRQELSEVDTMAYVVLHLATVKAAMQDELTKRAMEAAPPAAVTDADKRDAVRLDFMAQNEAWIAWSKDGESCRVFVRNEDGEHLPIMGWVPDAWAHDARVAIDAAIAASEQKGK